jgi:hypothetical protein
MLCIGVVSVWWFGLGCQGDVVHVLCLYVVVRLGLRKGMLCIRVVTVWLFRLGCEGDVVHWRRFVVVRLGLRRGSCALVSSLCGCSAWAAKVLVCIRVVTVWWFGFGCEGDGVHVLCLYVVVRLGLRKMMLCIRVVTVWLFGLGYEGDVVHCFRSCVVVRIKNNPTAFVNKLRTVCIKIEIHSKLILYYFAVLDSIGISLPVNFV